MGAKVESSEGQTKLYISYQPSPEAQAFIQDPTFATAYFGPLGCGKSTAGVMKSWLYSQAWPGARIAIIRDTYPNLIDTTQKTFFEWLPEGTAGSYIRSTRTFLLTTSDPKRPAEIIFRAMDQKDDVSNILSLDLACAWIDEPQGGLNLNTTSVVKEPGIDHDLFLLLQSRIGRQNGYRPMLWLTGNPPPPSHWIAKDFGYSGVGIPTNPHPDFRLYLGDRGNAANLTEGYYARLERLFGKETPLARRFLNGEWIELAQLNPFHASWFAYYGETEDEKQPKDLVVEIGFDPAISDKDTSNKSALVVAGQCRGGINRGRIYVLHSNAGHWSVYEQVDEIIRAAQLFRARSVRIEDVAYQRALKEVLEHELRQRNVHLYVDLVKPDGDKLRRANSWSAWVENKTVLFRRDQNVLLDCMRSVPTDRTAWDLVDAAGICVRGFPALQAESERIIGQELSKPNRAAGYAGELNFGQGKSRRPVVTFNPKINKNRRARSYATGPMETGDGDSVVSKVQKD